MIGYFMSDTDDITTLLNHELLSKRLVKCALIVCAEFIKRDETGDLESTMEMRFRTKTFKIANILDINSFKKHAYAYINTRIDDFIENGSNWHLDEIIYSDLEIGACYSLNGGCGDDITISDRKGLKKLGISSQYSEDKFCFLRAIAYHFTKSKDKKKLDRFIKKKLRIIRENGTKLVFPLAIEDIPIFERLNSHLKLKINLIMTEDDKKFFPLYCGKVSNYRHIINLLLFKVYEDEEETEVAHHYSYIEDMTKLIRKRYYSSTSKKLAVQNVVFCGNCLSHFGSARTLKEHTHNCYENAPKAIKMPFEGMNDRVEFENWGKCNKVNYVGFYDFETILSPNISPCSRCTAEKEDPSKCTHSTTKTNRHIPVAYSYIIQNYVGEIVKQNTYVGENAVELFLDEMLEMEDSFKNDMERNKKMVITPEDTAQIKLQQQCHICELDLIPKENQTEDGEQSVRDHCHLSGKFLGLAHKTCNWLRQESKFIPMFAHNASRYDTHLILTHMQDRHMKKVGKEIGGLALNSEAFKTLQIRSYKFLDSMAFLSCGLDELLQELGDKHTFNILDQMKLYKPHEKEKRDMLTRKGHFPYEWFDSFEKLNETELPPRSDFFSTLCNKTISKKEYANAKKVWKEFECQTFKDYVDIYVRTDVGFLAEIWGDFRDTIINETKLDPCHYISLPQVCDKL